MIYFVDDHSRSSCFVPVDQLAAPATKGEDLGDSEISDFVLYLALSFRFEEGFQGVLAEDSVGEFSSLSCGSLLEFVLIG